MIKVLQILNRMGIGGPAVYATYLTEGLPEDEFKVKLIAGQLESDEATFDAAMDVLSEKPIYIPEMKKSLTKPYDDFIAYKKIRKVIKEFQPDIVHTHASKPGLLGRLAAMHEGVPVIVHTYHGHPFHYYFGKFKTKLIIAVERYLAKISTDIIVISPLQKKEIVDDYKVVPNNKATILSLGFDLDKFVDIENENRNSFRKEFQLKDDQIAIGIIGRMVPVKDHEHFIRGLKLVIDKVGKDKVRAFIIGDGDCRRDIEELATSLEIGFSTEKSEIHDEPLVFTSWRNDVPRIMNGLDIVALTSISEGTPTVLIEAQAASKPIVSTNVGGIRDIVLENETALLYNSKDDEKLAEHIVTLIENEELRKQMSDKGYDYVKNNFDHSILIEKISAYYKRLLDEK